MRIAEYNGEYYRVEKVGKRKYLHRMSGEEYAEVCYMRIALIVIPVVAFLLMVWTGGFIK